MNTLLAATLNDNLAEIVGKLQSLMDSFWIYIVMALAAVVVVWGAFVGIKIAQSHIKTKRKSMPAIWSRTLSSVSLSSSS